MSAWQGQQYNPPYVQPWQPSQQGRGSWQDPRSTNQNAPSSNSTLAQTHFSEPQAFNLPNAPTTSTWGVRFNHTAQSGYPIQNKPPLPPRPASGLGNSPSPAPAGSDPLWQAPLEQAQVGHPQHLGHGFGQQWALETNQQSNVPSQYQPPDQSATTPAPPVPPPRPSAYQSQSQLGQPQWAHQQQLHHSALHDYDPGTQAQRYDAQSYDAQSYKIQQPYSDLGPIPDRPPSLSQVQTTLVDQPPPVSSQATYITPSRSASQKHTFSHPPRIEPGSSSLGAGGPSDWEHFQSPSGGSDGGAINDINAQDQLEKPVVNDEYSELPASSPQTALEPELSKYASPSHLEPAVPVQALGTIPMREQSVSPEPNIEGLQRTGTIDNLIQAWNAPLDSRITDRESRKSSVSTLDCSRREGAASTTSSPRPPFQSPQARHDQATASKNNPPQVIRERPISPSRVPARQDSLAPAPMTVEAVEKGFYVGLDPEYTASLARYAAMLRQEQAASDEEKYKIFRAFVLKENRLRTILYNIDTDDADLSTTPQNRGARPDHEKVVAAATQDNAPNVGSVLPVEAKASETLNSSGIAPPKLTVETSPGVNEDSYVVIERDDGWEYSPGGRPRMSQKHVSRRGSSHHPPESSRKAISSPSDYAPIVVEEIRPSPPNNVTALASDPLPLPGTTSLAVRDSVGNDAIKFEPPRPAYTPFRCAEGPQRGSESVLVARPAYQAYSALRNQSADSGRLLTKGTSRLTSPLRGEAIASPSSNRARREHEEGFMGLIREKSHVYHNEKQGEASVAPVNEQAWFPDSATRLAQALNNVRKIIPAIMPHERPPSRQIVEAKHAMDKYPDVFNWIRETVIKWDRDNRIARKRREDEKQARQEQSQKEIDRLFNDQVIGYSDIGQLESDFRLAEAKRKYDEDVLELESFTKRVFQPVTERLEEELSQLKAQYARATDVLEHESDSGGQYIHGDGDRASRSEAMAVLLALYKKLQIRYVKTAEAHYERERRRKQLELSVLHTNGDTAGVKQLEQKFSDAGRQVTLHEAREKDSRANKLMNTFDRATVRGLGDNQRLIDDVVAKLQSVNNVLKEKQEKLTEGLLADLNESLRRTEEVLGYVATDSKSLLRISDEVENMLNDADYEVSVAESRVAKASQESLKVLEEEKCKEDERIQAEADTRMGSVAKGPEDALSLLRSILKRMGDDPQHQDRVQRALEAAKLRNALKTPVPP